MMIPRCYEFSAHDDGAVCTIALRAREAKAGPKTDIDTERSESGTIKGMSHIGRGGNGARYWVDQVGKPPAPEGEASWETDRIPKKNGYPTAAIDRKKVEDLIAQGRTVGEVHGSTMGIAKRTVQELKRQFREEGHCDAGLYGLPRKVHRTIEAPHKLFLLAVNAAECGRRAKSADLKLCLPSSKHTHRRSTLGGSRNPARPQPQRAVVRPRVIQTALGLVG